MFKLAILVILSSVYYFSANAELADSQTPVSDAATRVMAKGDATAAALTNKLQGISATNVREFIKNPNTPGALVDSSKSEIISLGQAGQSWAASAMETGNKWVRWGAKALATEQP